MPVLTISATVHGVLIVYFIYLAFFSPFARLRIVDREYRKFNPDIVLAHLYYPPQILRQAPTGSTMTLEEIRERALKRREELAKAREKAEREKAEKEKKEKEEAERKAAEEAKIAAEKKAEPGKLTDINTAPIKDTVGKLYELYQAGGLDVPDMKLSVMASFKVEPDGSLSNIRIIKSSGSKIIDSKALEILWNIGESHALGQVAVLSSATISLDITDDIARLRITAFAPTPEIAKEKATQLNGLFWVLRLAQRGKSPEVAELLSLVRVSSRGKFVDTDLIVSREKAAQMLRTGFAKPGTPPQ
jgi:TonB family protein